jgi:hypothetical protein
MPIASVNVAPDAFRAAGLLDELHEESPEVYGWFRRADWPRRERVLRLLQKLIELRPRG